MALRVWLWLLSLSVLWGGSFFFGKVALADLSPPSVAFIRVSLAAAVLALFVPLRRNAPWRAFFAMGFLNNALPFSLIFWGQTTIERKQGVTVSVEDERTWKAERRGHELRALREKVA